MPTPVQLLLKRDEEEIKVGSSSPPWVVSYSDLITQILIFFVMFFALAAALKEDQLRRLKRKLDSHIESQGYEEEVSTVINEKGLVISLNAKYMFDPGKAELYDEAKKILSGITGFLISAPNMTRVEGHTDNIPIPLRLRKEFPSNWELSTARAVNVARYFIESLGFPAKRISSAGYGEGHPVITDAAQARFQTMEYKFLDERQRLFLQQISNEIPGKFQKYLPMIRKYLLYEGVEWERIVKNKMTDSLITFIKAREIEELKKYQLDKSERLVKACNFNEELRVLNRRVDIVVERMGTKVTQRERAIRVNAPALPVNL